MADNDEELWRLIKTAGAQIHLLANYKPLFPEGIVIAEKIRNDLEEIASVRSPNGRGTAGARKRLAKETEDLGQFLKRNPKYSNIEFKCINDYEKCRAHRGRYDLHCILAYIICMGRRLIPLVR
jgi:hypothetical protein